MSIRPRFALLAAVIVAAMVTGVHGRTAPDDAELQFQIGTLLFEETRFREALEAFRKATHTDNKSIAVQARIGVVNLSLVGPPNRTLSGGFHQLHDRQCHGLHGAVHPVRSVRRTRARPP